MNSIELAYLEASTEEQLEEQREVVLARRYHEGDQDVFLTDRASEFLGLHTDNPFRVNICRVVVDAVLNELNVVGFDAGESGENKPVAAWADSVWAYNRMDATQSDIHETALRDRESFVIVDWDAEANAPRLNWHQRYTSLAAHNKGDEVGVYMLYPDDDYTQKPRAAVQRWVEKIPSGLNIEQRQRMTVYYPNRIERYAYGAGWQPYVDQPGDPWPIWNTEDGRETGMPLGIPVFHFKNIGLRPEAWDAIPMQDAINKLLVDILASSDLSGFRMYFASGFVPTSDGQPIKQDGSNMLKVAPGQVIGTTKTDSSFSAIEGSDPSALVNTLSQFIQYTAMVTHTPPSRFMSSKEIASGDSQREQNAPFAAKVEARRTQFGNAWEDVMNHARKLANLFGRAGLDESKPFTTLWKHVHTPDELLAKKQLGVPQEQIWREMGYSRAEIDAMKQMDEYKARQSALEAATGASSNFKSGEQALKENKRAQ